MELITIPNRCYSFRGSVSQHAYFSVDKKVSKWPCDRARVRLQSARAAICQRPITINSRNQGHRPALRQNRELILNYFRAHKLFSSGVVEGLNNKLTKKPYGFRDFRCLELALYHSLGKLPEPESTAEVF